MTPSENMSERDVPPRRENIPAQCIAAYPEFVAVAGRRGFDDAGDPGRTEIDDLHRSRRVDHDVVGPDVLVQHLLAMEGAQPFCDLLDDAAHGLQAGFGLSIIHCVRVCPSMYSVTT